ncbi:FkbM family methyltransferase [Ammoniphilus resinae]|uniref:FkbM family methyltransferase n=1 Tax=Ammoniphilus resinae TaxID=861532 RepID=A0ABS4GY86_9BACL|nr:FkbM family methyltransferase [Ammoniphilus resinae]MBP1935002.1 FkbM family methyltransferase [Ammoniphilus resinae]
MNIFLDIHPGDIVMDCGANVGKITQKFAERGAFVYAFEPNPRAFEVLSQKFVHNPNVVCIQKGVWDRNTVISLYHHKEYDQNPLHFSESSSIYSSKINMDQQNSIKIEVIDLADFIYKINKPIKLLKMDIEGAEYYVLIKLIRTRLYLKIQKIIAETHADRIPELRMKENELMELIRKNKVDNIDLSWI